MQIVQVPENGSVLAVDLQHVQRLMPARVSVPHETARETIPVFCTAGSRLQTPRRPKFDCSSVALQDRILVSLAYNRKCAASGVCGPTMPELDRSRVVDILGDDPVAGNLALECFASVGPACLRTFLPLQGDAPGGTGQSRRRLARLCRTFGEEAIPILLEALEKAVWSTKLRAAECFDFYRYELGDRTAPLVRKLAERDLATARACLLALG